MKSVAVIGNGFVGGSLTTVLHERGLKVHVYDKGGVYKRGATPIVVDDDVVVGHTLWQPASGDVYRLSSYDLEREKRGVRDLVSRCEAIKGFSGIYFVCVPTPMKEDGSADLSIVEGVLQQLSEACTGDCVAVVKSTVPPGSTEAWNKFFEGTGLHVVFNPEFLREASALDDMRNQNRIVLGGPRPWINKVKQLFEAAFPSVPIVKTSSSTAEMVKYVTNVHLAVKVALANEFYQVCQALDAKGANIDYDKVVEYATEDERLGKSHWKVPGPMPADDTGEPAFGFAGSCFIKDLNALMALSRGLGIAPKVMQGAWEKNLEVRPQRDWEKLVGRAVSKK
jgi:UDPglucose 6-dehydrogenase